jgi:hypothetical protein
VSLDVHPPGRRQRRLPRASDEGGQILVITGVALVLMLCCVGLVVDVGHAMLVQRQLQAGVDAAALAGVQHLPDETAAENVAVQYSATPGSKNAVNTVDNAATTAEVLCIVGVPGCNRRDGGVNGIKVRSTSTVPTWFGRVIGINELKVSAQATACSPCTVKPLDIMIVLDRTGSMCQPISCDNPNNLSDLRYARDGIETFVSFLDPSVDKVGLALFPPVLADEYRDDCPYTPWQGNPSGPLPDGRYFAYDKWWHPNGNVKPNSNADPAIHVVASLEGADGNPDDDYLIEDPTDGWVLNKPPYAGTSTFLQRLWCQGGAGSTTYANSIEEAQDELNDNGRGNVQDIIIFLSDGGANTTQLDVPQSPVHHTLQGTNETRPCGNGVRSAGFAKAAGTIVYTIGYDLAAAAGTPEPCRKPDPTTGHQNNSIGLETGCGVAPSGWGHPVNGCTSEAALIAMASVDGAGLPLYYNKPNPGQLNTIFQQIAIDLSGARARLVDNTAPNLIG